ncbi:MAG: GyrI-like domain-containing protein [Candidatus Bathyarchaeia archaeon]
MKQEVTIVTVKPQLVLGMRKQGPYKSIATMIPQICQFAAQNNIPIVGPPMFVCHEMSPQEAQKADSQGTADVEVVVPVAQRGKETKEIKCYELAGGKMAKILHKGPYEAETATYQKLMQWLEENNKTVTGPMREIYLNDPREVSPQDLLIEIYAPIE